MDQVTETAFLPLAPAAVELGVPQKWLKNEADEGRIPCLRIGPRRLFNLAAVRKVLCERASTTAAELRMSATSA